MINPYAAVVELWSLFKAKAASAKVRSSTKVAKPVRREMPSKGESHAGHSHGAGEDESGHKHDAIGEFSTTGGGGARGKTSGGDTGSGEDEKPSAAKKKSGAVGAGGVKENPDDDSVDGSWSTDANGDVSYNEPTPHVIRSDRKGKHMGMNWKSKQRRLAIYHRDGGACVWCGNKAEDGHQMSLDHLTTWHYGGSHRDDNLITMCSSCNSHRQDKTVNEFAKIIAPLVGNGCTDQDILRYIKKQIETPPIERRHTTAALHFMRKHKKWNDAVKNTDVHDEHGVHIRSKRAKHHAHITKPLIW